MNSSIPAEARFHLLRKPKYLVIFLFVVFALAGVRAYAASVPSEDTYRISFTNDQITFRTERTTYTIADADESNLVKIPLYFWYSSSASDNTYMSGWVIMDQTRFMNFTFNTGSVLPSYFEAYDGGTYYCSSPVSDYRFTVYFDNHIAANNTPLLLGYYVFDVSAYTTIQIVVTTGTTTINIGSSGVYGSTGQYGLVQSIINGLDNSEDIDTIIYALQNIDTVDLESIIDGISSNTSLLTQIYQRLGQIQTTDQTFYNNIDNIIDTITWSNISNNIVVYNGNWESVSGAVNLPVYFDITGIINQNDTLYLIKNFPTSNATYGSFYIKYDIGLFDNVSKQYTKLDDVFIITQGLGTRSVIAFNADIKYSSTRYRYVIRPYYTNNYIAPINTTLYSGLSISGIGIDDIEYWMILSNLQNFRLYSLIESYINANVSSPVDSAATQAAGLAQNQAAAEQSLAALSPGKMEDLDSALEGMDILDTVQQSTSFWGYLIQQFSSRSGPLWGIFIFGLILGLIGFILRLRE